MLKLLIYPWLLSILWMLTGCQPPISQATTSNPTSEDHPIVALVMKTLTNPFFVEMERGARRAEQELDIQLLVKTAAQETSIEQQIEIVRQLVDTSVDAIVIAPGDSLKLIPVLKQAQQAGIVIINVDNRINPQSAARLGLQSIPFISVDNEQGAYLAARQLSMGVVKPTQAAIIGGIPEAANAQQRERGARRAFQENPQIQLVASRAADWKIDQAYQVTRQLFRDYPNVRLLFCANDMMALGAIHYLQEASQNSAISHGLVQVAGFDALPEAQQALGQGWLVATVDQQADQQGYWGVVYAHRALAGDTLPAETWIDFEVIHASNVLSSDPAPKP